MSLKEHREAKSDALVSMSRLLAKDKEEFYAYLNTAEGKEMYKLAMSEIVAEIEIFVSLGEISFEFDEGDYLFDEYNEEDRQEIGEILSSHLTNALVDIVQVLNKTKVQS
ncbi:hypothetical protein [Dubosiella newyorkensis]|uniref:hypothetical protein n=1 Tax=Dubosiella newyorkensis TaxID=1862672 RepID=UPI00248ACDFA|nr:hypothetical protein [Dubosiella newyorkensis]